MATAKTYATMRMPAHQARATQMLLPTGWPANTSRIELTIDVSGWCSANQRTGPAMVSVGTKSGADEREEDERVRERARAGHGARGQARDRRDLRQCQGEQDQDARDREPGPHSRPRAEADDEGDAHDDQD